MLGHIDYFIRIKVQPYHSIVAFGEFRFLLNAQAIPFFVEFRYAVAFGVVYPISEYGGLSGLLGLGDGFTQQSGKTGAVEDIISQYQTDAVVADE